MQDGGARSSVAVAVPQRSVGATTWTKPPTDGIFKRSRWRQNSTVARFSGLQLTPLHSIASRGAIPHWSLFAQTRSGWVTQLGLDECPQKSSKMPNMPNVKPIAHSQRQWYPSGQRLGRLTQGKNTMWRVTFVWNIAFFGKVYGQKYELFHLGTNILLAS